MVKNGETAKTFGLFDEAQAACDAHLERKPAVDPWPTVAIAGVRIDFGQPSAPRIAAATIFELGPDARPAALDLVPSNFRGFVSDLIERAIYNEKNKKWLK